MAPLSKEQQVSIIRRLSFMDTELADIKAYKQLDYDQYQQDRKSRRDVERMIENLINACLDIAKILLSGEDREVPATYRQVFIQLGEAGILDKDLALALAEIVRTRNVLAHQYLDIKWELVKDFLTTGVSAIEQFRSQVERQLITVQEQWEV
ncbi:DUF86 domain-containing protein [Moorellaceae bacterium AZ2]